MTSMKIKDDLFDSVDMPNDREWLVPNYNEINILPSEPPIALSDSYINVEAIKPVSIKYNNNVNDLIEELFFNTCMNDGVVLKEILIDNHKSSYNLATDTLYKIFMILNPNDYVWFLSRKYADKLRLPVSRMEILKMDKQYLNHLCMPLNIEIFTHPYNSSLRCDDFIMVYPKNKFKLLKNDNSNDGEKSIKCAFQNSNNNDVLIFPIKYNC